MSHSSQLFEPRTSTKEGLEKHANLCSRVLEMYTTIARHLGPKLSIETWELILKLIIGAVDSVLRIDAPSNQEPLQKKLCSQIVKMLFEVWLHSKTVNPSLWDALKSRICNWVHHMALISNWNLICQSLTKRTLSLLYGSHEGTDSVILNLDEPLSIHFDDEYTYYSWHRMLNILPNPNTSLNQPGIFLEFMNGVDLLVNLYLSIKPNPKMKILPISGNTILHIFGKWLIDAVHLDRNGFDDGTARAIKTLCNIMITKHQTNFHPMYTGAFYASLQSLLMKEGKVLVATICSSTSIFNYELKGIRALVPSYIYAIYRIMTKKIKNLDNVFPPERVRKDCLTILSTLLCFPNHFGNTPFSLRITNVFDNNAKVFDTNSYSALSPHFSRLLIESITCEDYPPNIESLLNLIYIFACEDLKTGSEFTKQALSLVSRKISQGAQSGWNLDVTNTGIKVLSMTSSLYPFIDKGYDLGNRIVSNLCTFIQSFLSLQSPDKLVEDIIINALKCITDWIMTDQWIFNQNDTKNSLFRTIVFGLTGSQSLEKKSQSDNVIVNNVAPVDLKSSSSRREKKKDKEKEKEKEKEKSHSNPNLAIVGAKVTDRIRDAAQNCLRCVLNQTGNFPAKSGAHSISTLTKEEEILLSLTNGELEKGTEYVRYFITDEKLLISVIDLRNDPEGASVLIIVRDQSGKFAWNTRLSYLPIRPKEVLIPPPNLDAPIPICTTPLPHLPDIHPSKIDDLMNFLANSETKSALPVVNQLIEREKKILSQSQYKLNQMISISAPGKADPYAGECKIQQSRMFLSHLGFLSLENRENLFPLNMSENFYQNLRELDNLPERDCIKVGVIYIQLNQSEEEAFNNNGGSKDYQEFIASLGWGISLDKHKGFTGTLDTTINHKGGLIAPYWANYCTELLFHVSTLMNADANYRLNQVINSPVVVCWNENGFTNFNPSSLFGRGRHNIVIGIHPLECGLYYIRLYTKSDFVLLLFFIFIIIFYYII